ncbi:dipeptide/oligopeptide/nickel ABC transporter ATP-binding protein [Pseudoclavibacter sp. RFBG4]|uniref:dipeptide/oligopeptide/nickel ABC transporter permease/ATP-binding protein n=1 Tax=Pseudoclavibacter sp. RFBG4 TaxID=2080575 RepID=UPI000CE86A04|nr:dipeptide/oligopeptide/nickel ABC transporter permease/ATP-binding protein [Pseudoclavibacter sp. RFBG4]PPG36447.1 dipeptide/oligopeptide/nickel ABC transporter ATP-binding protein [Pseudoclavibacter sp. RFBG4]
MTRVRRTDTALSRLLSKPGAVVALAFLVLLGLSVIFADLVAPLDPLAQDLALARQLPSAEHLLGTDDLGRDVFSRLIHGGAATLGGAVLAAVVAMGIGIPLGMIGGYFRGFTDTLVSRFADFFQALPTIVILMAVIGAFGNNTTVAMVTLGIAMSDGFVRLARATTLQVRRELYVDAANVAGIAPGLILFRHVLPNIRGPLLVQLSITMGAALLIQAGLGFLGLGTPPPAPSWGGMISEASELIYLHPWLLVPSGVIMILSILSFNVVGDALAGNRPGTTLARSFFRKKPAAQVATKPVAVDDPQPDVDDAIVSVRDLSVSFTDSTGEFAVVQGVSFDVRRGEALGMVGESGCGKSVTAKSLLGLVAPGGRVSKGEIVIDGTNIVGQSNKQLRAVRGSKIALVSQEPMTALDPTFTIGAQLREAIAHHTGRKAGEVQERALELLRLVGMPDPQQAAASYTFQVSGGMAQRAAIAMALTGEPEVLVADEPTTALDVTVQAEILDLLRRLREELGLAVIIVTHDLGVVADTCDRAVVMYAGQVIEEADVDTLLTAPSHPYTRALLAAMPANAVAGVPMDAISGAVPAPRDWPTGCRFAERCAFATERCRTSPVALTLQRRGTGSASGSADQRPAVGQQRSGMARCVRVEEVAKAARTGSATQNSSVKERSIA